jgi:hypothetical protein
VKVFYQIVKTDSSKFSSAKDRYFQEVNITDIMASEILVDEDKIEPTLIRPFLSQVFTTLFKI